MIKSISSALTGLSFFGLAAVTTTAQAQNLYTFDSYEVVGFTIASDVKPACKSASQKACDKGIKLCQDLGGSAPSVQARRLHVEGPYCTVTITFSCLTELN